jgi:hypothetical protein
VARLWKSGEWCYAIRMIHKGSLRRLTPIWPRLSRAITCLFRKAESSVVVERERLDLMCIGDIPIKRHVKVQAGATPYDPRYLDYFRRRWQSYRPAVRQIDGTFPLSPLHGRIYQSGPPEYCRVTRLYRVLEPDESKGSSPVLRGEGGRKAPDLPARLRKQAHESVR